MERNQDVEAYRQTYLKDKGELSGRSESEYIGGLESLKTRRSNRQPYGEDNMFNWKL